MAENAYINNITLDSLEKEYESANNGNQQVKKESTFDTKNYLDVRLGKNQKSKELKIRILPISSTNSNPFMHVHMHNVEVNKGMVEEGKKPFKSYICLNPYKNPFLEAATYGGKCPFCEENTKEYKESLKEGITVEEKKEHVKRSCSFKTKEAVIIRCIDRDHEDEGVKFWKINVRDDKADAYNQILNLWNKRKEESFAATGKEENILDLVTGKDLNITINQGNTDNQTTITVMDAGYATPLSRNAEQASEWISDKKDWLTVFPVKQYDFLKLVLEGKYPWKDKETGMWVDKTIVDERYNKNVNEANTMVEEAEQAYSQPVEYQPQANDNWDSGDIPF